MKILSMSREKLMFNKLQFAEFFLWALLYISIIFSYCFNLSFASIVILAISLFLPLKKMKYLMPVILFFYTYLSIPFLELSVFIPFSAIFLFKVFINKKEINFWNIIFIALNFIYCVIVLSPLNLTKAASGFLGVIFAVEFGSSLQEGERKILMRHYLISALLSGLLSYFAGSNMTDYMMSDGVKVTFSRFIATFTDPNYAGLFFSIGFWGCLILKPFNKIINLLLMISMIVFVILTNSVSAFLILILSLIFFYIFIKKGKIRYLVSIIIASAIVIWLLIYLNENYDLPYLSNLISRIQYKYSSFMSGDLDSATTFRTSLADDSLNYLSEKMGAFGWLFGGVCTTAIIAEYHTLHNDFLSLLFNFGIVGCTIYFLFLFYNVTKTLKIKNIDDRSFSLMCKFVITAYAFTLTMVMDFRFITIFLL